MNEIDVMKMNRFVHGGSVYNYHGMEVLASIEPCEKYEDYILYGSGGVSIRFISNSSKIIIRYSLIRNTEIDFPYMGLPTRGGIAISYRKDVNWYNMDCKFSGQDNPVYEIDMKQYIVNTKEEPYEMVIYCPVNSLICAMNIQYEYEASISAVNKAENSSLFIGTNNVMGRGITSSSFLISNVCSRKCNIEAINLFFRETIDVKKYYRLYLMRMCVLVITNIYVLSWILKVTTVLM